MVHSYLLKDDIDFSIVERKNNIEIKIKIKSNNNKYFGVIPNKLNKHGFKKYNITQYLKNYFNDRNSFEVNFVDECDLIYLYIYDMEIDGKFCEYVTKVELNRIFELDEDIDEINNFEQLKKITKEAFEYIQILDGKIKQLKEEIEEKDKFYDDYTC